LARIAKPLDIDALDLSCLSKELGKNSLSLVVVPIDPEDDRNEAIPSAEYSLIEEVSVFMTPSQQKLGQLPDQIVCIPWDQWPPIWLHYLY